MMLLMTNHPLPSSSFSIPPPTSLNLAPSSLVPSSQIYHNPIILLFHFHPVSELHTFHHPSIYLSPTSIPAPSYLPPFPSSYFHHTPIIPFSQLHYYLYLHHISIPSLSNLHPMSILSLSHLHPISIPPPSYLHPTCIIPLSFLHHTFISSHPIPSYPNFIILPYPFLSLNPPYVTFKDMMSIYTFREFCGFPMMV